MPDQFPSLVEPMVQLSAHFLVSDLQPQDREKFHETRMLAANIDPETDEKGRWVHWWEGRAEQRGFCRIETGRRGGGGWPPRNDSLEAVLQAIRSLNGIPGFMYVQSSFRTNANALPKKNYINLLTEVEMNFDGVGASLAGGRFLLSLKWTPIFGPPDKLRIGWFGSR